MMTTEKTVDKTAQGQTATDQNTWPQVQAMTRRHRLLACIYPWAMWMRNPVRHRLGHKSIGVCALVVKTDDTTSKATARVLLVRHSYRRGWCLPGGGLHRGETPIDALARELREEVGLQLTTPPVLRQIYLQSWFGMADYPILFEIDGDRGVTGTAHVADLTEILEVGWFPAGDLPADCDPSTHRRIAEWLGEQVLSDRW